MYCSKCGKPLLDTAGSFCSYCGRPVAKAAADGMEAPAPQSASRDMPAGVLWSLIFLCAHSVMWIISCAIYFLANPLVSTWNVIWTVFGVFVIVKLFQKSFAWHKAALWITGADAVWLLVQYFGTGVGEVFFFIAVVDVIAFVLLLVNKRAFYTFSKS